MNSNLSDSDFLKKLKVNPEEGISILLDEYGNAIKTICTRLLSGYSKEDIEEAIADSIVAFWRSAENYDENRNSSLKSYLYGITRITALNKKRQLARSQSDIHNEEQMLHIEDLKAQIPYEQILAVDVLSELIDQLKSPDKEIFIYRYYDELSIKEIALRLKLTAKAVENRLSRGKKILRSQLIANGFY